MRYIFAITALILASSMTTAQENYKYSTHVDSFVGDTAARYVPVRYVDKATPMAVAPRNVIYFIGDGMGTAQIFAALTANGGELYLSQMPYMGFSKTQSARNYITDSAAGGTALSCGERTYNGAIGVNTDTVAITSLLELCEAEGKATGLVSTSTIVHATPAAFIAHVANRSQYEDIASSFLDTEIDVFIGGGQRFFKEREDGRDLYKELIAKGYRMYDNLATAANDNEPKLGILTDKEHMPDVVDRASSLEMAVDKAINVLKNNDKGFFLMVEGSQIDWGGHQNDIRKVINETLDMDKALGRALEFAAQNGETLVVVTADHETGGLSILDGDMQSGSVKATFSTGDHSAVMVPVFTFGAGADRFGGIYQNDEIFHRIVNLLGIYKH